MLPVGGPVEEARFPFATEIIHKAYGRYGMLVEKEPAAFNAILRTERTLALVPRCNSSGEVEIAMFARLISQDWKSGKSVSDASVLYFATRDCLDRQMAAAITGTDVPNPAVCRLDPKYHLDSTKRLRWMHSSYVLDTTHLSKTAIGSIVNNIIGDLKSAVYEMGGTQGPGRI